MHVKEIFSTQKLAFLKQPYMSSVQRIFLLNQLEEILLSNRKEICAAVRNDFGVRSIDEIMISEIIPIIKSIQYIKDNIAKWIASSERSVNKHLNDLKVSVDYQPLGVIGIISPWNYPIYLTLSPVTYALSAGNHIMIKPSELAPNSSLLLKSLLNSCFPPEIIEVILGDKQTAIEFSELPFDHLLFSGSTIVGKEVMKKAAENLTPLTLELGGKTPAIIDQTCDLSYSLERVIIAKSMNSGQTCIAPDYLFVPEKQLDIVKTKITEIFSYCYPDIFNNGEYGSLINEQHYHKMQFFLDDAKQKGALIINLIEDSDNIPDSNIMPLTLVCNVSSNMALMDEEIFGPILPIITYQLFSEVVEKINRNDCPLSVYYFGNDNVNIDLLKTYTRSGSLCINDAMVQIAVDDLPFGGVGKSGFGRYHAKEGFITFSNARSLVTRIDHSCRRIGPPYLGLIDRFL